MSVTSMSAAMERYREHCDAESSIPIFSRDWWLDAVSEGSWGVSLVEKGGHVMASMPYYVCQRRSFRYLAQPPFTQFLGPWIRPSTAKYARRLSKEKVLLNALIDQLPDYDSFSQCWHYSQTNWLPFYWRGFRQTTLYTYVIDELQDEEKIWEGIDTKIRGDIRKARDRFNLVVRDDLGINNFYSLNEHVYARQNGKIPYSLAQLRKLDDACAGRIARKIFFAFVDQGQRHAAVYLVWDENSAYYLMGGGDPLLRNSGATSLLIWEAILFAATVTQQFDFEGSMIEPVERFFRGFGAAQTPYHNITRTTSPVLQMLQATLSIVRRDTQRSRNRS